MAAGFESLLEAMDAAQINTPARVAAFLTTLCFESQIEYNRRQITQTRTYYGRGFIQLTGRDTDPDANGNVMNYTDAGRALGVDLVKNPDLALSLEWSAKIAAWYWTKARPRCNEYADALQMGKINAAIGYPIGDGGNDRNRCFVFGKVLEKLTGKPVEGIDCTRPPVYTTSDPKGIWTSPDGYKVHNNVWNTKEAGTQTLKVWSAGRWTATANHSRTDVRPGSIKAYPCTAAYFSDPISRFGQIRVDYSTTFPPEGEWIGAFDVWINGIGSACTAEVMLWTHHRYNGSLPPANAVERETVTIDGVTYVAWHRPLNSGDPRKYIALAMVDMKPAGSVNLLAVFRWLVERGWLATTDKPSSIQYGVEIANTANATRDFHVNSYKLTAGLAS